MICKSGGCTLGENGQHVGPRCGCACHEMTALDQIKRFEESRRANLHDLGNADMDFVLRAFYAMRRIAIMRGRDANWKDERGDEPYDAGIDKEFECWMREEKPLR